MVWRPLTHWKWISIEYFNSYANIEPSVYGLLNSIYFTVITVIIETFTKQHSSSLPPSPIYRMRLRYFGDEGKRY